MADGLCQEYPGLQFVPGRGEPIEPLKAVCRRCLVRQECLDFALADPSIVGVWGATTERERKAYRKAAEARDRQALAEMPPWLSPEERARRAMRRGAALRARRPAG